MSSEKIDAALAVELKAFSYQKPMNEVIDRGDSLIQQFYCDTTVFMTGGSGFIGKQLIEKLFRSCNIKKMYLLMRSKKGKAVRDRLNLILQDPVFDLVRQKKPTFAEKIEAVEGDLSNIHLGLSDKDWANVTKEVNIIFHVAATVKFDEPLKVAATINVRGTQEALALAKNCHNLKHFVHVSTAYSHATKSRSGKEILEQFYPTPMDPDVLLKLVESLDEERINTLTPELTKGWPNTYTFTKAIAEEVIRTTAADLPVCIVRPPVVSPTRYEPTPGWLDHIGLNGPSGVFFAAGLGILHVMIVDPESRLAIIPLDYVNNAIIGSAWDSTQRRKCGDNQIPIYTVANEESLVPWKYYGNIMRTECRKIGTILAVWYCYLIETKNKMLYWILSMLLHYIPAYILDGVCAIIGKRPMNISSFVKVYNKMDKILNLYSYFLCNDWLFRDYNVKAMMKRMSPADRAIFNVNITKIDFKEYCLIWCVGVRKYILKDGLKNSAKALARQKLFLIANIVFLALEFYVLWSLASLVLRCLQYVFLLY